MRHDSAASKTARAALRRPARSSCDPIARDLAATAARGESAEAEEAEARGSRDLRGVVGIDRVEPAGHDDGVERNRAGEAEELERSAGAAGVGRANGGAAEEEVNLRA